MKKYFQHLGLVTLLALVPIVSNTMAHINPNHGDNEWNLSSGETCQIKNPTSCIIPESKVVYENLTNQNIINLVEKYGKENYGEKKKWKLFEEGDIFLNNLVKRRNETYFGFPVLPDEIAKKKNISYDKVSGAYFWEKDIKTLF